MSAVLMMPVLIQNLAARNGVGTGEHSKTCDTSLADQECVIPVFGPHYLDLGMVALYISSFSPLCEQGQFFTSCAFSCYSIEVLTANQLSQPVLSISFFFHATADEI